MLKKVKKVVDNKPIYEVGNNQCNSTRKCLNSGESVVYNYDLRVFMGLTSMEVFIGYFTYVTITHYLMGESVEHRQ